MIADGFLAGVMDKSACFFCLNLYFIFVYLPSFCIFLILSYIILHRHKFLVTSVFISHRLSLEVSILIHILLSGLIGVIFNLKRAKLFLSQPMQSVLFWPISRTAHLATSCCQFCSCLAIFILITTLWLVSESLWNEGLVSKSTRTEEKERERENRRETDAAKEKDKYKEKYWAKSIQELDLSDCQRCTPSYRLLPDDVSLLQLFSFIVCYVILDCSIFYVFYFILCSIQYHRLVRDRSLVLKYWMIHGCLWLLVVKIIPLNICVKTSMKRAFSDVRMTGKRLTLLVNSDLKEQ